MKFFILLATLCLVGEIVESKPPRKTTPAEATTVAPTEAQTETPTEAPTEAPTEDDDTSAGAGTSAYALQVKALIDDYTGTCDRIVSDTTECGDDDDEDANATGYYETFVYNGKRVIISSGAPIHTAEEDREMYLTAVEGKTTYQLGTKSVEVKLNPNRRCTRWQFAVLPLNPGIASSYNPSGMGTVGWVSSGGVIYNHLAAPLTEEPNLAAFAEIHTLDDCGGHADGNQQYHYHLIPYCWGNANDSSICEHIGYMKDGFPVYGRCQYTDGSELLSCWKQIEGTIGHSFSHFEFDTAAYVDKTCHLDEANGYTFPDGSYGYILTDNIFQTPVGYFGDEGEGYACGFTPTTA